MKKYFLLTICAFAISFSPSCKDDKEECAQTASQLSDKITAMSNAAIAYGMNQTTANCNAYKSAAQAYINAAQPLANCPQLSASERAAYQQAINDAQDEINNLTC